MKRKEKNFIITIILLIVFLILVLINLKIFTKKILFPVIHNSKIVQEYNKIIKERDEELARIRTIKSEEEIYAEELAEVKKMKEKQRMTFYLAKYITYLEDKNYEKAYSLLYDEYKTNYFPTLESFEKYAKEKYPEFMSIEHTYMSRQGEYYILTVNIYDLTTGKLAEQEQRYVIKENDFYDYVLSFEIRGE